MSIYICSFYTLFLYFCEFYSFESASRETMADSFLHLFKKLFIIYFFTFSLFKFIEFTRCLSREIRAFF